ncbi:MAG: haloacid dehalogenase type II [Phycisphaerales bacterium]|nr:haloacid dehalogenase type II [Phycisphaerales bacterium]
MADLRLNDFKALTFDCYGTLIDWERGILSVLRSWAVRRSLDVADDELLDAFSKAEHRCQEAEPGALYPDVLRAVHRRLADHFDVSNMEEDANALAGSIKDWPAFDDSPAALEVLKRHYKLVILSNIDKASFAHSNAKLGIEFDAIITAEDVGRYKPDHGHFLQAFDVLAKMGIARHEILHVAQSLFHDHVPAKALGLCTVWVDRRHGQSGWGATPPPSSEVRPDLVVTTLAELARQVMQAKSV